ncbi:Cytochrome P450 4C1 [Orchesella cincta]|uniref:Cytochrome P450 4C1 n=1 Tax=Orchesella cincta TaxID=48709 RepID=A0A1D2MZT8_ORCCI|nr:Cytochrome P450 4C1 [Orchesella cincta]
MKSFDYPHFHKYLGNVLLRDFRLGFVLASLFKTIQKWIVSWNGNSKHNERDLNRYDTYKSLPGPRPFPLKLIGNGLSFLFERDILKAVINMAVKYGPYYKLIFFNEEIVMLNSPEAAQALLMSSDNGHLGKGRIEEKIFPTELDSMLKWRGGEKWRARRKMLTRPFMYKSLQMHFNCFHKHCERLVSRLENKFSDNAATGVALESLKQCIFGISSETLMGVDIENSEDGIHFCNNLDQIMNLMTLRAYRPWLLIPALWTLSAEKRRMKKIIDDMKKVIHKVMEKYREKVSAGEGDADELSNTMIEVMLRNGESEKSIFDELAIMLTVANESTPYVLELALFLLACHPEHQELCRQEIDEVFQDPFMLKNGVLKFDALKELKQVERCIQESLRINPIVTIMRRLESPLKINEELVIPKDVSVVLSAYVLHHLPQYFPNPEKFDPDRFLPERVRERHPYSYIPFSGGTRSCIGLKLAMMELKTIVAIVLRNFEVGTPDTMEELQFVANPTTKPSRPFRFTFKKRDI